MNAQEMKGFFVAAITPFGKDGKFNPGALEQHMQRCIDQGASGFLMGGSSAECFLLRPEERIASFEAAAAFRGKTALMASAAALSTDEAIDYAKAAQRLGFDAIISTPPFYFRYGMPQIAQFFTDLRAAVDLPLFLYNFPGNTGVELDIAHPAMARILTDGTLAGVKQTSLNLSQFERMHAMNPKLAMFGGYDEVYLGVRALGGVGAIGSTFNFTLPLFTRIEQAYAAGDMPAAQALQQRANAIMQALVSAGLFPAIKHILTVQGLDVGTCRRPLHTLTPEQAAMVEKVVLENMPK